MLNEEGKDIRIIDLPDADQVEPEFYVPVDTYAGTKKYDLYDVTNEVDKAVDYVSTVSAQIEGKADKSELDGLEDQIAGKADAAVVYTKDEVDGLLEAKVDADEVYGKDEIDSMIEGKADYSDLEVLSAALEGKADSADVYTIDEINDLLDSKANIDSLDQVSAYVDSSLDNIQDEFDSVNDILDTVADDISTVSGAFDSLYDEVETAQSDISDLQTAIEDKVDTSDVYLKTETYSKEEVDTSLSGKQDSLSLAQIAAISNVSAVSAALYTLQSFIDEVKERWVLTPDERLIIDGKVYSTVTIGSQEWTVENLAADSLGGVWYNNDQQTYEPLGYGKLYSFDEMKAISLPNGWRVPTKSDCETLINTVGTSAVVKLKSTTGWPTRQNGSNTVGFSLLPAGYYDERESKFYSGGTSTTIWTTDSYESTQWVMYFWQNATENPNIISNFTNRCKYSIRLVRDI